MKSVGTITVDLKIKDVGGSRFGRWLLGLVARIFKIKLEVVRDEHSERKNNIPVCSETIPMPECKPPRQHTKCAVCLEDKPTPIRNDVMGGYVCLTCVDKELERLQGLNT